MFKTYDEAAVAVDEMFATAYQNAGSELTVFTSSLDP